MEQFVQDLRFALRSIRRKPLVAGSVVLTLALAIGVTTSIFSIAEGVLLEPLPYPKAGRVVVVFESNVGLGIPRFSVSALNYRDLRDRNQVFEATAAAATTSLHLTGDGPAERLFGVRMTHEFFQVLGRAPRLGRPILPEDDRPGASNVVVLSHGLWQRRFGARDEVLGEVVQLSGEPYEVVGVMPPNSYPYPREFFVPAAIDFESKPRGWRELVVFGRLKEGVPLERAQEEVGAIAQRLAETYPESNEGWSATAERWQDVIVEPVRPALLVLLGAVGLVLVIATLNTVNLMLSRLAAREREVAVRLALGASRGQLVRTFVVESLLLTLIAGGLGVALAVQGTRFLVALYGDSLPRGSNVAIDTSVLLVALGLSFAAGLVVGLVPALKATRTDLREALSDGGGGHTVGRRSRALRQALVFVEVALSLVLLVGAGLLIRSFSRLASVDPGFAVEGALTANLDLPAWGYGGPEERRAFYRRLFESLERIAADGRYAVSSFAPITQWGMMFSLGIEGEPPPRSGEEPIARILTVSPGYFETLGVDLLEGREFNPGDDEDGERVLILNRSAAERYLAGSSPVDRRIDIENHDENPEPIWWRVVGVVADVQAVELSKPPEPFVYVPYLQLPEARATVTVRTYGDPAAASGALRQAVAELDPALPLFDVQTLESLVDDTVARPRFNAVLLGGFAGLALLLAAVGVYGVLAYGVSLRRREMGIRQALGAERSAILKLVLSQGMRPVVFGLAAGAAGAFAANRLLASLLFGVGGSDPLSWSAAVGLLGLAGLAACWLPARQAMRIDPWTVLREE